jgi:hypothetical protein
MYGGAITANAVTPSVNMKSRIINGAMVIDQRNAGASVTNIAGAVYSVDRFKIYGDQASKFTAQQSSTAPVGFVNSVLITSSSSYSLGSGEAFFISQDIEGYNIADLGWGTANAQPVTLSFWVRSSLTGTFGGALNNSGNTRSYPFEYTISTANTFEYKTITIVGDTSGTWNTTNSRGVVIRFGLGVGSTYSGTAGAWTATEYYSTTGATSVVGTDGATFYITGVQLEKGSTATSFDYRPYGTELALCQRYFQTGQTGALGYTSINTGTGAAYSYPVVMRATPTLTPITFTGAVNTRQGATYFINSASMMRYALANATGSTEWFETFSLSIEL